MKKGTLLISLIISAFLISSCNLRDYSVAPTQNYKDFTVSNFQEKQSDGYYRTYSLDITNNGKEWIYAQTMTAYEGKNKIDFSLTSLHPLFQSEAIKPGQTSSFEATAYKEIENEQNLTFKISCFNPKRYCPEFYKQKTTIYRISMDYQYYKSAVYGVNCNCCNRKEQYILLLDITYEDKLHTVMAGIYETNSTYAFITKGVLDEKVMSIGECRAYQKVRDPDLQKEYDELYWSIAILLGIVPVSVTLIIVGITVPLHIRKKRQNLKKEEN